MVRRVDKRVYREGARYAKRLASYSWLTDAQRKRIVAAVSRLLDETDQPLEQICADCGINPYSIYRWASLYPDLDEIFQCARTTRAHRYFTHAKTLVDNIDDFWTAEDGTVRERQQSVNKAKFQSEKYLGWAAQYSPSTCSSLAKQIADLRETLGSLSDLVKESKI